MNLDTLHYPTSWRFVKLSHSLSLILHLILLQPNRSYIFRRLRKSPLRRWLPLMLALILHLKMWWWKWKNPPQEKQVWPLTIHHSLHTTHLHGILSHNSPSANIIYHGCVWLMTVSATIGIFVESTEALLDKLKNEASVIWFSQMNENVCGNGTTWRIIMG